MKKARHKKILSLINEYNIDRQEVLLEYLQKEGFNVTQATVSRDIKLLNLIKVSENGRQKYVVYANEENGLAIDFYYTSALHNTP